MRIRLVVAAVIVTSCLPGLVGAQEWPQFRGPGSLGVVEDASLPDTWSQTENVVWKAATPGTGWSSPVVWGDQIFITSVTRAADGEAPQPGLYLGGERGTPTDPHRWMLYSLDWNTGETRWAKEVHAAVDPPPMVVPVLMRELGS